MGACGATWLHLLHISPICSSSVVVVIHAPTAAVTWVDTVSQRKVAAFRCTVGCDVTLRVVEVSWLTQVQFGSLHSVRQDAVQK